MNPIDALAIRIAELVYENEHLRRTLDDLSKSPPDETPDPSDDFEREEHE